MRQRPRFCPYYEFTTQLDRLILQAREDDHLSADETIAPLEAGIDALEAP
jgi:hypothetical protein